MIRPMRITYVDRIGRDANGEFALYASFYATFDDSDPERAGRYAMEECRRRGVRFSRWQWADEVRDE